MEMCYDGALIMPSSYAVMDEEEMTYVEGGALKVSQAAAIIDLAFAAYSGGFYLARKFGSGYLKWWCKKHIPKLVKSSASVIAKVGIANTVLGTASQICAAIDVAFSWGSLGGVIANIIDLVDCNKRNGYVFG